MKKSFTLTAATALSSCLLLMASVITWAEPMSNVSGGKNPPRQQKAFSSLDADGNGKISRAEAKKDPQLTADFSYVDRNHDQAVDKGEFARFEEEIQPQQP